MTKKWFPPFPQKPPFWFFQLDSYLAIGVGGREMTQKVQSTLLSVSSRPWAFDMTKSE